MMSLLGSQVLGVLLMGGAFIFLARGIDRRANGKPFSPIPTFILLLLGVLAELASPSGSLLASFGDLLLSLGIGMGLGAAFLWWKKGKAILLVVPAVLAILASGGIYGLEQAYRWVASDIKDKADTVSLLLEIGPDDEISELEPVLVVYDAIAEKAFPNVDLSESEDLAQYFLVYVAEKSHEALMYDLRQDIENVDQVAVNGEVSLIEPTKAEPLRNPPGKFLANDPFLNQQWYAKSLDYDGVHQLLKGLTPKKKAKVAIVDTGVDGVHEDIKGVYSRSGGIGDQDKHSHGTHCAGLAGAATNNGKGVGSLNWDGRFISLSGYPALDDKGRGTDQRVAQAIIDAAEGGADVISMSLGGPAFFGPPKSQRDAIAYARKLGAIVVVAAGNSNDDARRYSPANIPGVITVSAVDENLNKAVFSNTNTRLKMPIAAPGVNILSSVPGSDYQSYNGTSMATPIVSGLVGMLKSFRPELSDKEVYQILHQTGTTVKDSDKVGRVINPKAALEQVMGSN